MMRGRMKGRMKGEGAFGCRIGRMRPIHYRNRSQEVASSDLLTTLNGTEPVCTIITSLKSRLLFQDAQPLPGVSREEEEQTGRQADRQTDRQTVKQTYLK